MSQNVKQKVSAYVQDWSLHGTLNGQEAKGEQVVWVQDKSGRTLVVGSGEMAFDSTNGRAKEGVGDMLVCLDPNTGDVVYTKVDDVTFFQTQKPEDFGNEYRNKLQQINSQAYNEAAQEQAAKSQNKEGETGRGDEQSSIQSPENGSAAALSALPSDSPSVGKGTENSGRIEIPEQKYSLSEKKTAKGDTFYQDESGNINMAEIPDEVFTNIGYTKAPFRLTESMVRHILTRHGQELGISTPDEAIHFVRDVMANFDHVRLGNDGALVFSIENGRKKTGKRAITIFISEEGGDFYGLKTSGFESMKGLEKRPLLWERGVKNDSSSTATATANVATNESQLSGEQSGNASNQSIGLDGKDTNNSSNGNSSEATLTFKDGNSVPMTTDSKGRPTPDYGKMTAEQAADVMTQQFGEDAEKVADAQIKKAEKALKDAEKMKVDFNAEPNDILEQKQIKGGTIAAAKEQLQKAQDVKKALTAQKVAETMKPKEETPAAEGAHEAGSVAAEKFQKAPRLKGNTVTKRLPTNEKVSGHYEIVPAESLTPSHDVNNGYKKSEGFPVDAEGRTINDRDYENDKAAQQTTDQMAQKYSGQAITQVPTVSDEGIVYDGNGRTMAGQKAAKQGTDAEYIEDLMDNAQNYGFTKEQIAESGIKHPRLVMVTDERLPYDTATFAKFNRNEKKSQSNTEQAVAKAKTLTADEIGAIVADIEGNGSLEAFFNNSKAINDLVKTLQEKGVIGQNEVAGFMDGTERLSAQGKEYVKNLLLGSVFKPETIRMLGIEPSLKNKAISGIRAIMDNMKLGDYSLRDEIDNAVKLLYEARRSNSTVDDLLKQSSAFEENARDRFSPVEQAIAQALEGSGSTLFRDLMREYNDIAKHYNTGEADMFGEHLSPEELVKQFLETSKTIKNNDIKLYGNESRHSEQEGGNHAASNEEPAKEAGGTVGTEGSEPTESQERVNEALKHIATEITKQTGIEVVTDERVGQETLEDSEDWGDDVKYNSVREQRASAGSTVSGMDKMPKDLQMNPSVLTDQILHYHGDHIAKLLDDVPEDGSVKYSSAHNGVWYFYRVDHDRNIILDDAISANKDNYREYEQKIKEYYGIDGGAEAIYNYVQEAGFDTGTNRNLHDYFLEGGNTRYSAMGERPNEQKGEARVEDNGTNGRTLRQGVGEDKSGAVKEFRSKNGEVYGFTVDGKIYLDTKKMKPETPLHEYTHLWTAALKRANPKEWENVKKLFDEVEGLKEEVSKLYPELKGDDLYEEMITTYSGREGAKKLEEVVRGLASKEGKTIEESSKAQGFLDKVKTALQKYWKGVADMLHIHFTSAEEVADKVLADWAKGVNPKDVKATEEKPEPSKDPIEGLNEGVMSELTNRALESGYLKEAAFSWDTDKEMQWIANELKGILKDDKEQFDKIVNDTELFGKIFDTIHSAAWNAKSDEVTKKVAKKGKKSIPLMPKTAKPDPKFNPIEAAAEDYKKEHPMTEEEIRNSAAFDGLPEDQKQYCIDAAIDYLNGEDTSSISEAYYRNAYEKRAKVESKKEKTEVSVAPTEGLENTAGRRKETKKAKSATERVKEILQTPKGEKPKTASRKELEAERDAADNEFETFMKELRKKRSGQLNSGFLDQNLIEAAPKMFSLAAKCAYSRIKLGMYDAKEVVKDLRSRFKEAFEGYDKRDIETFYSQIMSQKWRDGDKRIPQFGISCLSYKML